MPRGGVVDGEEIVELADCRVVLSLPEGIFQFLHLVYLNSLLDKLLLGAPLDSQQTAFGAAEGMGLQQDHVVNANMLELLVLAIGDEVAEIYEYLFLVWLEVVGKDLCF